VLCVLCEETQTKWWCGDGERKPYDSWVVARSSRRLKYRIFFSWQMTIIHFASCVMQRSFTRAQSHTRSSVPFTSWHKLQCIRTQLFKCVIELEQYAEFNEILTQRKILESSPAVTKRFPSGSHAQHVTISVCFLIMCLHSPVYANNEMSKFRKSTTKSITFTMWKNVRGRPTIQRTSLHKWESTCRQDSTQRTRLAFRGQ
jgi:heme/copper-type cytochrome/quinol oxidase subunit 3